MISYPLPTYDQYEALNYKAFFYDLNDQAFMDLLHHVGKGSRYGAHGSPYREFINSHDDYNLFCVLFGVSTTGYRYTGDELRAQFSILIHSKKIAQYHWERDYLPF